MAVQGQPTGSEDPHVKVEDGVPGQEGSSKTNGVYGLHEDSAGGGIQSTIEGFQVSTAQHSTWHQHRMILNQQPHKDEHIIQESNIYNVQIHIKIYAIGTALLACMLII